MGESLLVEAHANAIELASAVGATVLLPDHSIRRDVDEFVQATPLERFDVSLCLLPDLFQVSTVHGTFDGSSDTAVATDRSTPRSGSCLRPDRFALVTGSSVAFCRTCIVSR